MRYVAKLKTYCNSGWITGNKVFDVVWYTTIRENDKRVYIRGQQKHPSLSSESESK